MIFLKRYKKFTYERYTDKYEKRIRISGLFIYYVKYLIRNNFQHQATCDTILKSCITRDVQTRNINDRKVVDYEKISISYNIVNSDCDIIYSVILYDYKKYEILDLIVKRRKYGQNAVGEQKILYQKQINYCKLLDLTLFKRCHIL